jgi:cephalosporin hydroxylase
MNTIFENYKRCCITPSDIYKHLPILYKYATKCTHITEFGTRNVTSTWAFAYSLPEKIIFYDVINNDYIDQFLKICTAEGVDVEFKHESTTNVRIEETDLLFIDTMHTYAQVKAELQNHHKVKKYIILHDTTTFGEFDHTGVGVGIRPAINEFLDQNKNWKIEYETAVNNGLMVLQNTTNVSDDKSLILGVPVIGNSDLLNACILSLIENVNDYSPKFYFVNNTKNSNERKKLFKIFDSVNCDVFDIKTNIGVSRSWNIIISNALHQTKTPYILSTDLVFKSSLDATFDYIESNPDRVNLIKSYNFFSVTENIVREIGWFDNNIFPAYCEDCDFSYRIKTNLGNTFIQNVPTKPEIEHLGSQTLKNVNSDKRDLKFIGDYRKYISKYYELKWGGRPGYETYTSPFNII